MLKPFVNTLKSSSPMLKKVCATQLGFLVIKTECLWDHPLSASSFFGLPCHQKMDKM